MMVPLITTIVLALAGDGVPAAQARVAALTTEASALLQGTRGDTAFLVELVGRMAARRN